jgi:hypothetical protein
VGNPIESQEDNKVNIRIDHSSLAFLHLHLNWIISVLYDWWTFVLKVVSFLGFASRELCFTGNAEFVLCKNLKISCCA